jgi:ATP-dependent RNA helicase MRH4
MAPSKIPFTISYSKFGTKPPIFVAGTFTDPEWTPQEMQYTHGSDGELMFTAEAFIQPDTDYQYKFRLGNGDWWVLDESLPIVYDDAGNQNNLLKVSSSEAPKPSMMQSTKKEPMEPTRLAPPQPNSMAANFANDLEVQADDKPIRVAALDDDGDDDDGQHTPSTLSYASSPLFAHESLGGYAFVDDCFDHDPAPASDNRRISVSIKDSFLMSNPDIDDPTLEKFPSDRTSIFDALRKVQTTLDDDVIQADGPFAASYDSSRRTSVDSGDDSLLSVGSLSPTSTRRRESRHSHSSVGRNRSAVSLGSIAEEDQHRNATSTKQKANQDGNYTIEHPSKPAASSRQADDDSGLTMGSISKADQGQSKSTENKSKSSTQPRSMTKKSGKSQGSGVDASAAPGKNGNRTSSYPKFITNVFEDARTNLFTAGGLLALALGFVWLQSVN